MGKSVVPRNPDDTDNGVQPDPQELLRHQMMLDANIAEEENRENKIKAMAEFGLTEEGGGNKVSSKDIKKAETVATTQSAKIAELEAKLAALEAQSANANVVTPVEGQQTITPPVPPVPAAPAAEANPFAEG